MGATCDVLRASRVMDSVLAGGKARRRALDGRPRRPPGPRSAVCIATHDNTTLTDKYRAAHMRQEGWIRAGGIERDVTCLDANTTRNDEIDTAYHTKYRRYRTSISSTSC